MSLYNETEGRAILPTPTIGGVGLIERLDRVCADADVVFPRARLQLIGVVEDWLGGMPALEAEETFKAALAANRGADAAAGGAPEDAHLGDEVAQVLESAPRQGSAGHLGEGASAAQGVRGREGELFLIVEDIAEEFLSDAA